MERLTERMKTLLGPFVLRRLKADVASQLAPKDQRVVMLNMTPVQAEMYTAAVSHLQKQAASAGVPNGECRTSSALHCSGSHACEKPHASSDSTRHHCLERNIAQSVIVAQTMKYELL